MGTTRGELTTETTFQWDDSGAVSAWAGASPLRLP